MFGQNPIRKADTNPDHLFVQSMFYTIQGEGPFSGRPALFIRMAGCNLACHFCDTEFESGMSTPLTLGEVVTQVQQFPLEQRRLVVLTGGEPMRQEIGPLCSALLNSCGVQVIQIETAGTLMPARLLEMLPHPNIKFVCSPKTPKLHPDVPRFVSAWKYVIRASAVSPVDGLPMLGTSLSTKDQPVCVARPPRHVRDHGVYLSPCDEYDPAINALNQKAAVDSCLKHGYTLNLQIHKIVGVE